MYSRGLPTLESVAMDMIPLRADTAESVLLQGTLAVDLPNLGPLRVEDLGLSAPEYNQLVGVWESLLMGQQEREG